MLRPLRHAAGWILLAGGAVIAPLPPPFAFGWILLLAGIYILIGESRSFRRILQRLRARFPRLSRVIAAAGAKAPPGLARLLTRTDPKGLERFQAKREPARRPETR